MEAANQVIKQSWVWLFAIIFFFFNNLLFVDGLTMTLVLTPIWLYFFFQWQLSNRQTLLCVLSFVLLYAMVHIWQGANIGYYSISTTILLSIAVFTTVFYKIINTSYINFDGALRRILVLNFFLTILALALLSIPSLKGAMWYIMSISKNIEPMPRLKMFTSEASHYSYLWALPTIYFFSRVLFFRVKQPALTLFMVSVPLLLSFSLGVLSALIASALIMLFAFRKYVFRSRRIRISLIFAIATFVLIMALLWLMYPQNPLFLRIGNIMHGDDTSAKGRTIDSFILANKIIASKSYLFGIGPGQLKVFGRTTIIQYYHYSNMPSVIRIPNACAETIICFGYTGFAIRMMIQLFLFIKTQVYKDPFRLWLFFFLFLYQFTGSYITNVNEYMLWAIAFAPFMFPDFHRAVSGTNRVS
jgi:hypothetical protein